MDAVVNAGGKGTRMGRCGIEKPMLDIGGQPTVMRVINALKASPHIDRILVSVSDNTPETCKYLKSLGIEVKLTSGESFMDDLHESLRELDSDFVFVTPSDLPLLTESAVNSMIEMFNEEEMESVVALVDVDAVKAAGIVPSYTSEIEGKSWVYSGLSIMDRKRTLSGEYLKEFPLQTNWFEIAINVNTMSELQLARTYFRE